MSEPYPFTAAFERSVVIQLCTSAAFYGVFADAFEDAALPSPEARLLAQACRMTYVETGRGPGSAIIVEQRLRRHNDEGKVFVDDMLAAVDYLLDGVDRTDHPDEETVRSELAAVVSRRATAKAMDSAFLTFAQRGDMLGVANALTVAQQVGKVDMSVGDDVDTLMDDLEHFSLVDKLTTGCGEMNSALGGGFHIGTMNFALAPTKAGKSLWLSMMAVLAVRVGLNVMVITLELPSAMWRARYLAGLTGTPTYDIIQNPRTTAAVSRYHHIKASAVAKGSPLGHFSCKKMAPGTTMLQIFDLVKRQEDKWGAKVHSLIIDYCDRAAGRDTKLKQYEQMLQVYEDLRVDAESFDRYNFTASQAKGNVAEGEMPNLGDCADSQNKVRVTDSMTGLQKHICEDHRGKVSLRLIAVRNGEETSAVGPFESGAEYGVFLKSVAFPEQDVHDALVNMPDDEDYELGVFR